MQTIHQSLLLRVSAETGSRAWPEAQLFQPSAFADLKKPGSCSTHNLCYTSVCFGLQSWRCHTTLVEPSTEPGALLSPADNTASIFTRRTGFRRSQKSTYLFSVVISDGVFPIQSSTSTLTIRVCTCSRDGAMELCNMEALSGSAGLSTGALVAILLCVLILLCEYLFLF